MINQDEYLRFKRRTEKRLRDLEASANPRHVSVSTTDVAVDVAIKDALHYLADEDIICARLTLEKLLERLEEA